jgi:hypothetical protein
MAIRPTKAYARYKSQSDALLDFAVLVAHSVPALRSEIQLVKSATHPALPRPDFFQKSNRSTPDDLLKTEAKYEQYLASYVLLAHFSFFESFVEDLIKEMFAFHGGEKKFVDRIENRLKRFVTRQSPEIVNMKRKLQETEKAKWRDRYRKYSRDLDDEGFRFPGELLAAYGVRSLILKMKNLKAVHIPDVLVGAFQVDLSEAEVDKYHEIREIRNGVAHGDPAILTMRQAVEMNGRLRDLALKISSHLAEHFFMIEKYVPGNPFST